MSNQVVHLHAYRDIEKDAEKELSDILWRLLQGKHRGNILSASEDFALARAGEITLQMVSKGVVDRDELYDAMIAWGLGELGVLQLTA